MLGRELAVLSVCAWLAIAGCGAGAPVAAACTEGEHSTPYGVGEHKDPCLQVGTPCADAQRTASSICGADGRWQVCKCDPPQAAQGCGNGVKDDGEECDGADLGSAACADLITGTVGPLSCNGMCSFDTSLCTTETGVSGTGGGGQGG